MDFYVTLTRTVDYGRDGWEWKVETKQYMLEGFENRKRSAKKEIAYAIKVIQSRVSPETEKWVITK